MNLTIRRYLPLGLVVLGLLLAGFYFSQPVTVVADGAALRMRGLYLNVGSALRAGGVTAGAEDRLSAGKSALIPGDGLIFVEHARPVSVWTAGLPLTFNSVELIPANLLARVDLRLFPGDLVLVNGRPTDPLQPLARAERLYLQFRPAAALDRARGRKRAHGLFGG